jgi:cell division protein DivIC
MKITDWINQLPKFFRNFFFLFTMIFIVWMIFFDANDLISQYKMSSQLNDLENEREYYQQKIIEVKAEQDALLKDKVKLEKFAREHYLMKKPTEDIYILVEEK